MDSKRIKLQLSGQITVNFLERCLTLSLMAEERMHDAQISWFAYLDNEEASWSNNGCPDDYVHADAFGLSGADCERFLDWCANQRHYFLLCEKGMDDHEANTKAQDDRTLLRGTVLGVASSAHEIL